MKFNKNWILEWVTPAKSQAELLEQITLAGLEVDGIEPVSGPFSGVVIGHVVECEAHPNADKLRVTKIDIGEPALLNIVCGASNCRIGLKVACARIGAELPGDIKIKAAKLRDVPSEGMLCSFSELGIVDDHPGIIELPDDAPIGKNLWEYLELDDISIEISLTPNRADCLGILGIARDVAVLNQLPFHEPDIKKADETITDILPITVEVPEACPRYLGRIIKDIDVQATTPLWMKEKLRRCGMRSIDAVVDITNYVLLEFGYPMHAFDLNQIDGGIVVRKAHDNEKLVLLDGNTVTLTSDVLLIADQNKPLALAGIFGGEKSGINHETKDVLLEAAYFSPLAISGRARQFKLHTEASHRYERGVDPNLQYRAMERATGLLLDICGGKASSIIDVTNKDTLPKPVHVILRRVKLDKLLGHYVADETVTDILVHLGCKVDVQKDKWLVVAPSWRFDIKIEEDLIEEVARVYGYDNIPTIPLHADLIMTEKKESILPLSRIKTLLVDKGYQEAITYSFVDPKIQQLIHPEQQALQLPEPISSEMSLMRLSLWSGLLSAVVYNQNRQQSRIRLFESGLRFIPDETAEFGIRQERVLSGVITGQLYDEHWQLPHRAVDFYDVKGDLESIFELMGKLDCVEFKKAQHSALHPGQSANIFLDNEEIGCIGALHPLVMKRLDLNGDTIVFEVLQDKLINKNIPLVKDVSRYPINRRDISIVIKDNISAHEVLKECKGVAGSLLKGVQLFDVYKGKGISEGYKSLAIALLLQDGTRTLEDEEIAIVVNRCIAALEMRFQATLRE